MRFWRRPESESAPCARQYTARELLRPARLTRRLARWYAAPVLGLLLALIGCGAATLPITHRPASDLRLEIHVSGQYGERYGDGKNVNVWVRVLDGTDPNGVALPDKARVTCGGTSIKPRPPLTIAASGPCPRQAPGGAYQIIYTDEHGVSTSVTVPVPTGSFAILSPLAGSAVSIPTNGALTVRVSLPTPPPNETFSIESVATFCGAYLDRCGGVAAPVKPAAIPAASLGQGFTAVENNEDKRAASRVSGLSPTPTPPLTPTPAQPPTLGPTPTPADVSTPTPPPPASATMVRDGNIGTITLRGDFAAFAPNTGEVTISVKGQVTPDRGGFAAVTASYDSEYISSTFTWTR